MFSLLKKIDAFSAQSDTLSARKVKRYQPNCAIFFTRFFSALKVKCFQPNFAIFSCIFFTNSKNGTISKFSQEMLNILSALKFPGSHLTFYDCKVIFSLISPINFSLGWFSSLGMPISRGSYSKGRQNTVPESHNLKDSGYPLRNRRPIKRQDTPRVQDDEPETYPLQSQKRRPSPIRIDGKGKSYQHSKWTRP